jgi:hypothetical protein
MSGDSFRFRLLPLAALLCVGSCMSTEGYYRYQDGGPSGTAGSGSAGSTGTAGDGGTSGSGGVTGSAGTGGGPAGGAGSTATAGRGGTTGAAGRGGTTGAAGAAAGRGGTTGSGGRGGTTGTAGSAGVLFSDDFESGSDGWNGQGPGTHTVIADGSQVFSLTDLSVAAGDRDQHVVAAGNLAWTDVVIEARVKPLMYAGTDTAFIAAICARLTDLDHFYYFGIQGDGRGKIKIQNSGNSSLSSSINFSYVANTWYTLKLSVVGPTITAYINGTMVGQETDSTLTVGAVGVMVQEASAVFDDIVVRAP